MTSTEIVLLVLGILVAIAAIQLAIWIPVLRWIRRTSEQRLDQLRAELSAAGERISLGPEPGLYRGASPGSGLPHGKGNSVLALTERRLIIRRLVGAPIELATAEVAGVRTDKWFQGAWTGDRLHVIVKTRSGDELGFFVADPGAWVAVLQKLAP